MGISKQRILLFWHYILYKPQDILRQRNLPIFSFFFLAYFPLFSQLFSQLFFWLFSWLFSQHWFWRGITPAQHENSFQLGHHIQCGIPTTKEYSLQVKCHHMWTFSKQMSELEAWQKCWPFWHPTEEKNILF